ncbi:family 43 glycosylhydrolase [Chloroflexia bacterium SDU3-3]|nr:family 43 glycosylhydrolase [Chloroflexia bacterium SDU3-3]
MSEYRTFGNPYLPSWEYVPDGEPHVFGDRVYVYGSHDRFNGHVFCLNDYVCWSAPVDDLTLWRYEGVSYKKTDDPLNPAGAMCLYAPDVTQGPDGRFYLYYVLDKVSIVSVAVADRPAGPYTFYGYVRHASGELLGERAGDEPQFDPAVLTEGETTYLYTGFCSGGDESRHGAMACALAADMLTVTEGPSIIVPSRPYGQGSGFEGHEFFEASSIRRLRGRYYFVYSSVVMHELCYATSDRPDRDFRYGGVIVSNNDLHIGGYKPEDMPAYYGGNNHGGLVEIGQRHYVFYHRHTHGTTFCRQGCIEPVVIADDGSIAQVSITSQGMLGQPLPATGEYPAFIACNLFCRTPSLYTAQAAWPDNRFPLITQDGRDDDREPGYVANMMDGAVAGFKYFACAGVRQIHIRVRGYCRGSFEVATAWDGPTLGSIAVDFTNVWTDYCGDVQIPDGVHALYFRYQGEGRASLASFRFA